MTIEQIHPHTTLRDVDEAFQKTLHMPDLGALHVVLATLAANRMEGTPVWLLLIGPPASAKTETVETLCDLPDVFTLSTTTKAGLLSGSSEQGGTGGVLMEAGSSFVLVLKDFTTICSEHASTRGEVLAIFRELFDGRFERAVGTGGGRMLKWRGRAGCIACATEAIDTVDMANFGERWVRYRLPASSPDNRFLTGLVALESLGHEPEHRSRRRRAVTAFFAGLDLPERPPVLSSSEQDRLIQLADLATRCRSGVVWGGPHGDEMLQVPQPEEVPRLVAELGQLAAGLNAIGVSDPERWRLLEKCALDAMSAMRRKVLQTLVASELDCTTATIAGRCRLPQTTARRHLQELAALGLCDLTGDRPERWCVSGWLAERWRELGLVAGSPSSDEAGR